MRSHGCAEERPQEAAEPLADDVDAYGARVNSRPWGSEVSLGPQ